jgi:hypothetical protein
MTRPAFAVSGPFNNECDAVLWDEKDSAMDALINASLMEPFDPDDVVVARVDEQHGTFGEGVPTKLDSLELQILSVAVPF